MDFASDFDDWHCPMNVILLPAIQSRMEERRSDPVGLAAFPCFKIQARLITIQNLVHSAKY
jgi:hypothetical protein